MLENDPEIVTAYSNLGKLYGALSEPQKAFEYLNKSLTIKAHNLGSKHQSVASTYVEIANMFVDQGGFENALIFFGKSLSM